MNSIATQVTEHLGEDLKAVERMIEDALESDISLINRTNAAILSNSGKKLRPILSLLVARACTGGHISSRSVNYAAAAELLHNATLLHDDVADNSPTRRGAPTVMSMLGPRASVLLGDYWLVRAMETILKAEGGSEKAIRIFSKTLSDLAEGEMLQLQKASLGDTREEDYYRIIFNKTASLFVASALCAAHSVEASEELSSAAGRYAEALGLAFQIQDDILDYCGDARVGKPIGQDIREQKMTLPLLEAMKTVSDAEQKEMRALVHEAGDNAEAVEKILSFVETHDGIGLARKKMDVLIRQALDELDAFPNGKDKELLAQLALFVGERHS